MPVLTVNGIRINYYDDAPPAGAQNAPAVLLVMGSGGSGRAWHLHQVPALVAAGFRVISFDNRGIAPSEECPGGFGIDDLVADTAALVEELRLGPAGWPASRWARTSPRSWPCPGPTSWTGWS